MPTTGSQIVDSPTANSQLVEEQVA